MEKWPKRDRSDLPERFRIQNDEKKETGLVNRRTLLKGIGAVLAVGASSETGARWQAIDNFIKEQERSVRFDHWLDLPTEERERRIDEAVESYGNFVRSPEGLEILDHGTDQELFTLLRLAPPILREHIAGTKYDIPKDQWPSVLVPIDVDGSPSYETLNRVPLAEAKTFGYGNGVFVDDETLLTNVHVAQDASDLAAASREQADAVDAGYKDGIDAVYLDMSERQGRLGSDAEIRSLIASSEPKTICPLAQYTDKDVHGKFVTVAGIDPDRTAAPDGTKIYPAVAVKMTKRMARFLKLNPETHRWCERSFLYLAPPGETLLRQFPPQTGSRALDLVLDKSSDEYFLEQGTSGSPVLMWNGTGHELVGLNHRGENFEYGGMGFDIGYFHGPDTLRLAKERHMELFVAEDAN